MPSVKVTARYILRKSLFSLWDCLPSQVINKSLTPVHINIRLAERLFSCYGLLFCITNNSGKTKQKCKHDVGKK